MHFASFVATSEKFVAANHNFKSLNQIDMPLFLKAKN